MKLSTRKLRKIINESIKVLALEGKSNNTDSFKLRQERQDKQTALQNLIYLGSYRQTEENLNIKGNFITYSPGDHKDILFEYTKKDGTVETKSVEQFLKERPKIKPHSLQLMEKAFVPELSKFLEPEDQKKFNKMYNEKIENYTPNITQTGAARAGKQAGLGITGDLFLFLIDKGQK
jgi:hypothetical protein